MIGIDFAKILTDAEYALYIKSNDKAKYFATCFAAKEAFLKANGVGLFHYRWKDMMLTHDVNGKPHIFYKGEENSDISVSHDGDYVVVVVLLWR